MRSRVQGSGSELNLDRVHACGLDRERRPVLGERAFDAREVRVGYRHDVSEVREEEPLPRGGAPCFSPEEWKVTDLAL